MKTIFDLPAHPLVVHLPVVLVPLAALGVLVVALRPGWRSKVGPVLLGAGVVGFVGVLLARSSGDALYDLLQEEPSISRHRDLANQATVLTLLFVLSVLAWVGLGWFWDRSRTNPDRTGRPTWVVPMLSVVAVLLGALSSTWVARTGHEGAKSHWSFVSDLQESQSSEAAGR